MTKQEKLTAIENAFTFKTWDNGKEGYIHNESTAKEIIDFLQHKQYELGTSMDLSYDIYAKACDIISDHTLQEIESNDFDAYELSNDSASIYNSIRLEYLNNQNDDEIADTMKEYSCKTVSEACAIWYDQQVSNAINTIRDFIIND